MKHHKRVKPQPRSLGLFVPIPDCMPSNVIWAEIRDAQREGDWRKRIAALREMVQSAFPARLYEGKITPADGEWTPELDDDEIMYNALKGRRWTEIPN